MHEDRRAHRRELSRRRLLRATGVGTTVLVAGCFGEDGGRSSGDLEESFQDEETTEQSTPEPEPTEDGRSGTSGNANDGPDLSTLEQTVHEHVNELRKANGVGLIGWDEELHEIAKAHSEDMILREFFDHVDPMRNDWDDRYRAANYECIVDAPGGYRAGGEAIARVSYARPPRLAQIASDVVDQFRELPSNSAVLAPYWEVHGIGAAFDRHADQPTIYVTENFC